MKTPESPLHHSLLFSARSDTPGKEGETAWTMEFTVFRSRNGFRRHAEWTGIFERRSRDSDQLLRKVFRRTLSFPSGLEQPERLLESPWACEGIRFDGRRYSGSIAASDGDLNWNFEIDGGEDLAFRPLERWLPWRTVRTRVPVRGSWSLATRSADGEPFAWSSSEAPATAILQLRDDRRRIVPTVWFHAQSLRDTSTGSLHCAEGLHALPAGRAGPALTSISAFEPLLKSPDVSLWRALRSSMPRQPDGWSFRTEQQGLELRGRIQVEPRHWVTLRHEDVRGRLFYRTSARMARLEVLALERGKPRGFFATPFDTWLEWTTRERPIVSPELR